MAKKKRQTPKKGPGRPPRPGPDEGMPELPDPKVIEGLMRELLGDLPGAVSPVGGDTPLDRAQELMYRAFDEPDSKKRVKLARKALDLSPDCADAYLVLADEARTRKETLALLEQAVAAGERALGPEAFERDAGYFWGLLETRPYMRARERLADILWTMGRRDEAAEHLREMLRLNPNDNQGVRYTLASWLLNLDRDDELEHLLDRYEDDASAAWAYTRALLAFRRSGDSAAAKKRLKEAKKANKHVPAYLLGEKPMPARPPGYYGLGDDNEAVLYAAAALSAWKSTPGAVAWLRAAAPKKRKKAKGPAAEGPTPLSKERLRRLPREFDTWQADAREFPRHIEAEGHRFRPWMVLVTSRTDNLVLGNALSEVPPTPEEVWDALAAAMLEPAMGEPHRPAEVQVRSHPTWDALRGHLAEIDVECVEVDVLDQLDFVHESLTKHLESEEPPGLLAMPGMTPGRIAGFFAAAAEFYRRAPWRALGYEATARIDCPKFESGPWYAVVMGQSGLTLGLALYEDLDLLRRMWAGDLSDEENARETVALSVTFDDASGIPPADFDAAEANGWEVAGPEAYPAVFRKERGMSMRPPLAWELELLEGCLRALPAFVVRRRPDDPTPETLEVPTSAGPLPLTLTWVADDEG
ncbi:MAG TPA: hypothetical protein VG406_06310 [Isosphaeraceae bacterium]|nr:hypothetical protein [Isosphaeraceae bacterium]